MIHFPIDRPRCVTCQHFRTEYRRGNKNVALDYLIYVSKKFFLSLVCTGIAFTAFSQEEPGTIPPEASFDVKPAISEGKNINDVMAEYLNSKKWHDGENKKSDGSLFFIATGTGIIQAPRTDNNYPASRVAAFDKAMLAAKQQMAEYVGQVVSTSVSSFYEEGNFLLPPRISGLQDDESTILAKVNKLIHAKLDKALHAEGIDPDKAAKEALAEALKKQINSEDFKKTVNSVAQSLICGLQASKTFEIISANTKGQIGVVAIWSPKLQKMAEIMAVGGTIPNGIPKKKITEQIPADPQILLLTMGVQQLLDEEGRLTLVSYGQSGALTDSPTSANAARNKARLDAVGKLRQFAGENVVVISDMINAETTKEFEVTAEEYSNESRFSEKVTAVADAMKISGIATIKNWQASHPITGKTIYGVICTWSPTSAANAQALGRQLNANPQHKTPSNSSSTSQSQKETEKDAQQRSFNGVGLTADDDAF